MICRAFKGMLGIKRDIDRLYAPKKRGSRAVQAR
jgi:hypothetical protein